MLTLVQSALIEALVLLAIPLGIALVVGVIVSFGQAVTQIQDTTVSVVPKLAAVGFVLWLLGPRLFALLVNWTQLLWTVHAP